jgi:hypothetical protein
VRGTPCRSHRPPRGSPRSQAQRRRSWRAARRVRPPSPPRWSTRRPPRRRTSWPAAPRRRLRPPSALLRLASGLLGGWVGPVSPLYHLRLIWGAAGSGRHPPQGTRPPPRPTATPTAAYARPEVVAAPAAHALPPLRGPPARPRVRQRRGSLRSLSRWAQGWSGAGTKVCMDDWIHCALVQRAVDGHPRTSGTLKMSCVAGRYDAPHTSQNPTATRAASVGVSPEAVRSAAISRSSGTRDAEAQLCSRRAR